MSCTAITICQPYAHLIVTPQAELPSNCVQKRVENRTWATHYRGELLIHAGKSTKYMDHDDAARYPSMVFGAVIGIARLVDCLRFEQRRDRYGKGLYQPTAYDSRRYPWLTSHPHAEGPFAWILSDVRRLIEPVAMAGHQGFWKVEDARLVELIKTLTLVPSLNFSQRGTTATSDEHRREDWGSAVAVRRPTAEESQP